jgi:CRISPR system Cascade subunit CasE
MYLSRLLPSIRNAQARRDLANSYDMHRTVMRAFPSADVGGPGRVLLRVDVEQETQQAMVLVQSEKQPDWVKLATDYLAQPPKWKELVWSFQKGQRLRFRLRCNPTIKQRVDQHEQGKRMGLLREEDQVAWLARSAARAGFCVNAHRMDGVDYFALTVIPEGLTRGAIVGSGNQPDLTVSSEGTIRSRKGEQVVTHLGVRFDGLLTVTDADIFHRALACGIGPAKAFGFGLLSIAPAG